MKNRTSSHFFILCFMIVVLTAISHYSIHYGALIRGYETSLTDRGPKYLSPFFTCSSAGFSKAVREISGQLDALYFGGSAFFDRVDGPVPLFSDPEYTSRKDKAEARQEKIKTLAAALHTGKLFAGKETDDGLAADAASPVDLSTRNAAAVDRSAFRTFSCRARTSIPLLGSWPAGRRLSCLQARQNTRAAAKKRVFDSAADARSADPGRDNVARGQIWRQYDALGAFKDSVPDRFRGDFVGSLQESRPHILGHSARERCSAAGFYGGAAVRPVLRAQGFRPDDGFQRGIRDALPDRGPAVLAAIRSCRQRRCCWSAFWSSALCRRTRRRRSPCCRHSRGRSKRSSPTGSSSDSTCGSTVLTRRRPKPPGGRKITTIITKSWSKKTRICRRCSRKTRNLQKTINVDAWFDILAFQPAQATFGLASGGTTGRGLGLGYPELIPVADSDYIFAALAEELGLFGGLLVIFALIVFVSSGVRTALDSRDMFSKLCAIGLAAFIGFQALVNIGGITRALPMTGITLPFVSHGGFSA